MRRVGVASAVVSAGLAMKRTTWSPVRVEGDSMEPTLPQGSLVAVAPMRRSPSFGAVVVVRRPDGSEHLKRVVGTPGDRVRLEGVEMHLERDRFAVAGDNRPRSTDSRHYGPVGRDDIVGIARLCYWPPRSWRLLPR